jgi:hypothetical protein
LHPNTPKPIKLKSIPTIEMYDNVENYPYYPRLIINMALKPTNRITIKQINPHAFF